VTKFRLLRFSGDLGEKGDLLTDLENRLFNRDCISSASSVLLLLIMAESVYNCICVLFTWRDCGDCIKPDDWSSWLFSRCAECRSSSRRSDLLQRIAIVSLLQWSEVFIRYSPHADDTAQHSILTDLFCMQFVLFSKFSKPRLIRIRSTIFFRFRRRSGLTDDVSSLASSKFWYIGENHFNCTHSRPSSRLSQNQNEFTNAFTLGSSH